ncbi:MAG: 50S ribosomal protein L13 [Thermomicrobiales bacterium]|nr:50S ribosomal protein L13 [Thermomicrobiales bacterium]MCO5226018.1 50S ribosomal protein L13 [Thermomicrobiales bacterium]MCO5229113.1 50S ribosomal protein L13 [Thermomicrobiales bacterium]
MDRKTYSAKAADFQQRNWFVVDAEGVTLGRLATTVAATLRGKHKATYTPHVDTGDFVVVINAEKVKVTGKKETQKNYYTHSMYPGGLKTTSLKDMRARHPERIIEHAVRGMLPGSNLGRQQLKKLKVYAGPNHPHEAQAPVALDLDDTATR